MQERNPGKDRDLRTVGGASLAPCDSLRVIPGGSSRVIPGDCSRGFPGGSSRGIPSDCSRVIPSVVEGSHRQAAMPGQQRKISVGILEADKVEFSLGGETVFVATECDGQVVIGGEARPEWYFAEGCAERADRAAGADNVDNQRNINNASPDSVGEHFGEIAKNETVTLQSKQYFTLKNVEIGKGFHWQRYQDQSFPGDLKLIARHGRVIAINVVGIEDYLQCVIASEMSPSAGFEFLKAHAVISRSWLLAQLDKRDEVQRMSAAGKRAGTYSSVECDTPDELIRWQDREDHEWFDFCADDHCQRYQGIPMAVDFSTRPDGLGRNDTEVSYASHCDSSRVIPGDSPRVIPSVVEGSHREAIEANSQPAVDPAMIRKTRRVIEATWGQVLTFDGRVCDARFSKCCGGALEEFKYCWENKEVPYLKYARDWDGGARIAYAAKLSSAAASASAKESVTDPASAEETAFGSFNASETAGFDPISAKESVTDPTLASESTNVPDLRLEIQARRWILSSPRAFCNTRSKRLLSQVLKDYDSETKDFYRWKVEYSAEELRQIIKERTGDDYGHILDLIPLERGVSGRICRLKIVGSKKTKIIGKELEIRKTLSRSHLYSSAFVIEKVWKDGRSYNGRLDRSCNLKVNSGAQNADIQGVADSCPRVKERGGIAKMADSQSNASRSAPSGIPAKFILRGAGWGHGVGLCQIGAAAMGARGYKYQDILRHYYPGAGIRSIYSLSRGQRESEDSVLASAKPSKTADNSSRGQRESEDGVLASHNKDK